MKYSKSKKFSSESNKKKKKTRYNEKFDKNKKFHHKDSKPWKDKNSYASEQNFIPTINDQQLKEALISTNNSLTNWSDAQEKDNQKSSETPEHITLDPWQKNAVNALLAGDNVIVDAPTTAGKTKVVEAFFDEYINKAGFRACYTCPVKSLSNDKLREFREKYGKNSIGIATGDIKENLDAPVVIATLESYRNSLLGVEPDLSRNLVIFDEYHFLQDGSRGSAWEEAIILTPPECQVLLLSASLSNADEFAQWLEKLSHRNSKLIQVSHRPVPLVDMVWFQNHWLVANSLPEKAFPKRKSQYLEPIPLKQLPQSLSELIPLGLTPCIIYAGKRLSCDLIAQALSSYLEPIEREKRELLGQLFMQADKEFKVSTFIKPSLRKMIQVYGVAFHHSGLAPLARLFIESLVKEGHLRFCVATMGLSLGINFSVKSTVISDGMRPGESGFTPYSSSEILQMTGRAGRRGKDKVGFSCWLNVNFHKRFAGTNRDRCDSRLKNDPTTFLGLVSREYSLGKIEKFYRKSFRSFNQPKANVKICSDYRVEKILNQPDLPCKSPAHEYMQFKAYQNSLCYDCVFQKDCHNNIPSLSQGSLAHLHMHLHEIGALNNSEKLSPFGELARYFPQAGGMLIASMIEREEIRSENLLESVELMASFALARFKSPQLLFDYRLPFSSKQIEKDLESFYPYDLFPEIYEVPKGRNKSLAIKEFNPSAGAIVKFWLEDCTWKELLEQFTSPQFGPGDLTGLLFRSASYLQSISQAPCGHLSQSAKILRENILREPLQIIL